MCRLLCPELWGGLAPGSQTLSGAHDPPWSYAYAHAKVHGWTESLTQMTSVVCSDVIAKMPHLAHTLHLWW